MICIYINIYTLIFTRLQHIYIYTMLYELIWFMNPVPCGMHKTPVNIGIYYYLYVYLLTAAGDLLGGFDPFCHDKSPFVEYVVYCFRRSKNQHLHPKTNMSPEN